jgi:polysaccharide export outer membrane protein
MCICGNAFPARLVCSHDCGHALVWKLKCAKVLFFMKKHKKFIVLVIIMMLPATFALAQSDTSQGYLIQPGDILEVSVWKEEDLQREVLVRPDGQISFPLVGDIDAKGKTVSDLRAEITARLQKYIPNLVVTVTVARILGKRIYVIGQVNNPGEFVVNPRVDVMQALSMAGGTTPFAKLGDIIILRRDNDGTQSAIRFRYNQVESGRSLDQNIVLSNGDVVVVP